MTEHIHVIAEAGNNHNAKLATAKELVDVAKRAEADSVKFQIIYPEGLYLPRFYKDGAYTENDVFKKRADGMLSDDDYRRLAAYCQEAQIPFTASVFDKRGIDLVDELNAPYIKIASTDLNNSPLLVQAAERKRRMIVSTGMSTLGEVEQAISDIVRAGNDDIVLLHCVSVYPCPTERMNLSFITSLQQAFGLPVGLSDHTESSIAVAVAVALGVTWVEKHYTLNRTQPGFDHAYAMEPEPFAAYVRDIRAASSALRRPPAKVGVNEATTKQRARRALYAVRALPEGHVLTADDVLIVRPEGALRPNDLHLVVGRRLARPLQQYEALTLEGLG